MSSPSAQHPLLRLSLGSTPGGDFLASFSPSGYSLSPIGQVFEEELLLGPIASGGPVAYPLPALACPQVRNATLRGRTHPPAPQTPATESIASEELMPMMSWFTMPELDDQSTDVTPQNSEDEADSNKTCCTQPRRSRKRKNSALVLGQPEEESDEAKLAVFPALEARARHAAASSAADDAVGCLVHAFTEGHKHGRPLPAPCEALLKRATDEVGLSRKKRARVKSNAVASAVDGSMFPCTFCTKVYNTSEGLRLHVRNHHEVDKRWICHAESCPERAFVRQADLRMHIIRVHSPTRPFPCRVPGCNKAFSANNELRRHIANFHQSLADRLFAEGKQGSSC